MSSPPPPPRSVENDDDDDDDEMADLFSFSAATPVKQEESLIVNGNSGAPDLEQDDKDNDDDIDLFGPQPAGRHRTSTSDSVLGLMEQEQDDLVVITDSGDDSESPIQETATTTPPPMESCDTQEILDWLDKKPDPKENETPEVLQAENKETASEASPTIVSMPLEKEDAVIDTATTNETTPKEDPPDDKSKKPDPPEHGNPFGTLKDAIESPNSTMTQIRRLYVKEHFKLDSSCRARLWCRSICGKPLEAIMESSIADSFLQWDCAFEQDDTSGWIQKESSILADRIVAVTADVKPLTPAQAKRELASLLMFHYTSSRQQQNDIEEEEEMDPLLPPVACTLLSAGIPTAAASVALSQIVPTFMPLLALAKDERLEASKSLHTQFYLLACYHLPLLVHHMDRYAPGWHWPLINSGDEDIHNIVEKNRNLENNGMIPQSWLISHLAGECDGGTMMNPKWLAALWDLILVSSNNSLRFFFSLALLEKHSDTLLMTCHDALHKELKRIIEFKEGTTLEGCFAIEAEEDASEQEAVDWVQEWCDRARALWESTPRSVVSQLRTAEDEAVVQSLQDRQEKRQEALQQRLEAEAKAHAEAIEAEKERRLDEARAKLTRERLLAYYKKHNPEKQGRVDKILETFEGRLHVLDAKLKKKYGVGFNPALKPKPLTRDTNKLLSTMNQSINVTRRRMAEALSSGNRQKEELAAPEHEHQVTVKVSPGEVLPILCWSKEGASRGVNGTRFERTHSDGSPKLPMKFFLVDSRPSDTCHEQGRFPTAVNICPETLLDPDRMQQHEEMFESLRGAVHICIMGEGFSAVPVLFGQKLSPKLEKLTKEDESRTNLCALFFLKKGFPFVSILDGGFAAAHAWLAREGPKRFLAPDTALVDYNENVSLFAQLESAFKEQEELANATTRGKTQRALQNLLDGSLASSTRNQKRLEGIASELESKETRQSVRQSVSKMFAKKDVDENDTKEKQNIRDSVSKIFAKSDGSDSKSSVEEKGPDEESRFQNPFAGLGKSMAGSMKKKEDRTKANAVEGPEAMETSVEEAYAQSLQRRFSVQDEETDKREDQAVAPLSNKKAGTMDATSAEEAYAQSLLNRFSIRSEPEKVSVDSVQSEEPNTPEVQAASPSLSLTQNPLVAKPKQVANSTGTLEEHSEEKGKQESTATKKNRFAGLGSALNNMKANAGGTTNKAKAPPQMLKRNPFARFGAPKSAEPQSGEGVTMTNRFAGLNNLRMRVQGKPSATDETRNEHAVGSETSEEYISFVDNDDADKVTNVTVSSAAAFSEGKASSNDEE